MNTPPAQATTARAPGVDAESLVQRVLNITLQPRHEWPVIAAEPPSIARIVGGCVLPLAAIQALLHFVHMAVIGVSVPFVGHMRMPFISSLTGAVIGLVFALIGLFVCALIVNAWAPFFGGKRSLAEALKVAAYASVPAWLGAWCGIVPWVGMLIGLLAALYAIYVLYLGLPVVMRAPRERALGYTIAVILSGIVLGVVMALMMGFVGSMLGGAIGGSDGFSFGNRPSAAERHAAAEAAGIDQGAAITGSVIGGLLGSDDNGKAALGQALGNLARAGQQMDAAAKASARSSTQTATTDSSQAGNDSPTAAATGTPADQAAAAQQAGAAVGGLLAALGGAAGGSQHAAPVDFRTLQGLLPDTVNGMKRGAARGENKQAMGIKASSASAAYAGADGSRIDIKIADMTGLSGLMGLADSFEHTSDSETNDGFERDTKIAGRKAHVKYSNASRHGELQVIVAKRFEVDVEGSGVDMAMLERALQQVDLNRLESMKDSGAKN